MSDPIWPDLSPPFPGGGQQQSADPAMAPSPARQGVSPSYGPAEPAPVPPFAPSGAPQDPSQQDPSQYEHYGQQGQYGEYAPPSQGEQYGQQPVPLPALGQSPNPFEGSGHQTGSPVNPYDQAGAAYVSTPAGRPATPSRPLPFPPAVPSVEPSPFSRPAAPSRPLAPAGRLVAPSRPLVPEVPSGRPAAGLPSSLPVPLAPRGRSLRWLWITLGVLVVLIATGVGGAAYVVGQLGGPTATATQFCTDFKVQSYDAAYSLVSSSLRAQYPHDQFVQGGETLDRLEGQVTGCQPSSSGSSYNLGANTAAVAASITRSNQPDSFTGRLHLVSEDGTWKVSGIDSSLLGVNLGALRMAVGFCAAAQSKDYRTATSMIDSALDVTPSDWGTWDQIGGTITSCTLQGFGAGNTDHATTFQVSVSRSRSGNQTGALALALESGTWKVSKLHAGLLGPDLAPLKVGAQFFQDILTANYAAALGLLSASQKQTYSSVDSLAQTWAQSSGVYWASFTPILSTFKVSGTSGSYQATATISTGAVSATVTVSLSFVQEGGNWKVGGWNL